MRLSELELLYNAPSADILWAFVEEFRHASPQLGALIGMSETLEAFWHEVVTVYSRLSTAKRIDLLPADFLCVFLAYRRRWSFSIDVNGNSTLITSPSMPNGVVPLAYIGIPTDVEATAIHMQCYLSNFSMTDRTQVAELFSESKYRHSSGSLFIKL